MSEQAGGSPRWRVLNQAVTVSGVTYVAGQLEIELPSAHRALVAGGSWAAVGQTVTVPDGFNGPTRKKTYYGTASPNRIMRDTVVFGYYGPRAGFLMCEADFGAPDADLVANPLLWAAVDEVLTHYGSGMATIR